MQAAQVIVFSLRVVPPAEKRWALVRSLSGLIAPTRVEPGCLEARLYHDLDNANAVTLVEEWETREQFEMQLEIDKLKTLIAAIELSSEAPVIHIDTVGREEGIQFLGMQARRSIR
jgi:quinol monooxygenase YgiN